MERFCGMLQNSLHSHSRPWSNLNKVLLHCTYLEQLRMRYNLLEELKNKDEHEDDGPIGYEHILEDCEYAHHCCTWNSFLVGQIRTMYCVHPMRKCTSWIQTFEKGSHDTLAKYYLVNEVQKLRNSFQRLCYSQQGSSGYDMVEICFRLNRCHIGLVHWSAGIATSRYIHHNIQILIYGG